MTTPIAPATSSAVPATSNASAGAPANTLSESMVQASVVPAKSVVGYVFKVTEKDTGRVIVELPFQISAPDGAAGEGALAPLVDLKA